MAATAIDTGVLVAMADTDDDHHEIAMEIVRQIDHGDLPTAHVTNYVILETLNWIHARHSQTKAVAFDRRLAQSAGFEVHHAAQKDFGRAHDYCERYAELSFGDATIVAYMARTDLEYLYAFDDDFDAVEHVTRLASAHDPFA